MDTAKLKTVSEQTGPAILGAGVAMLTVALFTSGHGGVTAAARPGPTVTATVTASPAPADGRTTMPAPYLPGAGATILTARESDTQPVSAGGQHPGPVAPSGPKPAPTAGEPATSCTGIAALRLLGRCALTVGGNR